MTNWVSIWFEKKDPTPLNKYKWENVYQENQNEPPIQIAHDFLHWNINTILNIPCGSNKFVVSINNEKQFEYCTWIKWSKETYKATC